MLGLRLFRLGEVKLQDAVPITRFSPLDIDAGWQIDRLFEVAALDGAAVRCSGERPVAAGPVPLGGAAGQCSSSTRIRTTCRAGTLLFRLAAGVSS